MLRVLLAAGLATTLVAAPTPPPLRPTPCRSPSPAIWRWAPSSPWKGQSPSLGVFASNFFDEGFAVQDLTGGIYVSMANNLGLRFRQQARVTGTLTDIGWRTTGSSPRRYSSNDGSGEIRAFINTGAGISVAGLAPGQFVFVTGFSGQFIRLRDRSALPDGSHPGFLGSNIFSRWTL